VEPVLELTGSRTLVRLTRTVCADHSTFYGFVGKFIAHGRAPLGTDCAQLSSQKGLIFFYLLLFSDNPPTK